MSEWIKTSENPPRFDKDTLVLVYGPHGIELVSFNAYYHVWDDSSMDDYYKDLDYFEYWHMLPEPPNEP